MAERTLNSKSTACREWEPLLADALDGLLKPAQEAAFSAHIAVCPACAKLLDEARKGSEWLKFLAHEPEVPAGLVDRILSQTGPGVATGHLSGYGLALGHESQVPKSEGPGAPSFIPNWQRPGFIGFIRRFAEPRLMMTAAMAFFSIAMTLNLTGVRLGSLRLSGLRPDVLRSYMERKLTLASTPLVRYYDHSQLVYDLRTTVRELRQTTQDQGGEQQSKPSESAPGESKQAPVQEDNDPLQASLAIHNHPAHSCGSQSERSTRWIA
jgi:hypothetical protein